LSQKLHADKAQFYTVQNPYNKPPLKSPETTPGGPFEFKTAKINQLTTEKRNLDTGDFNG